MEHSASELMSVGRVGNLAKSGKAQKLDNSTDYDRWLHIQAGKLFTDNCAEKASKAKLLKYP